MENRDLIMVLTTSMTVLIGCIVVLVWRWTAGSANKAVEPPKLVIPKVVAEPEEVDDGRKKVTIFFGTQTGTVEGFAKDDYAADDEEYEEKLKTETLTFFFLAT
ncbi:cytochrome P450 reductase [Olea europaea subsp. europaea]|uniref:Cytochrome P450 reductase n=1 Tax=Olea europaea subsp. europaea TaxID=158383 RepID=A0A8S0QJM0_OLEEU|nr:cytochrome P450 reductase [Olea europaea subsp. europaea]